MYTHALVLESTNELNGRQLYIDTIQNEYLTCTCMCIYKMAKT